MKHLLVKSTEFLLSSKAFKQWLETLNFSSSAITNYPNQVNELFHFLESKGIERLNRIETEHLEEFIKGLKIRANQTHGGGISSSHINGIIKSVLKFLEYLRLTKGFVIYLNPDREINNLHTGDVLSQGQVIQFFNAIELQNDPILCKLHRAILSVVYGAGLRKSELEALNVDDVLMERRLIHVRKGKGGKERLVPITGKMLIWIKEYITEARDMLIKRNGNLEALFINARGQRMLETAYYSFIKQLQQATQDESILVKKVSLHTFRHSIATHLLQKGMGLERIKEFLGHSTLAATTIYLHYLNELEHGRS